VSLISILLAGFGVWLLVEGALCALAPDFMRDLASRISNLPSRDLIVAGLAVCVVGAGLLSLAVRTA
jgi:uncharacterized protein YjeT (DUF2065 family)